MKKESIRTRTAYNSAVKTAVRISNCLKLNWISNHKNFKKIFLILPFLLYFLLSYFFFGPQHLSGLTHSLFNAGPDPETFVWFLYWWPHALLLHINPFVTRYIWFPAGFNLTWATSIPSIALIMSPITLLFRASTSYNMLALIAPALSAASCFYLIYFVTKKYLPSLFGGYIYGFSSYEITQLLGHPNLYISFLIPLAILLFLLRFKGAIKKVSFILLMTLVLVVQFGISTEIYSTFIVFSVMAFLIFYFLSDKNDRKRMLSVSFEIFWAVGISLILLSPFLYYLLIGYKNAQYSLKSPGVYSTDLLNYIIPTPITRLGSNIFEHITGRFTGNYSEEGAYLGIPLILIIFHFATKYWRKSYAKALVLVLIVLAIFSLGPLLQVNGVNTHVPLPWAIGTNLPFIQSALPTRFTMYVFFIVAIIVGLWLSSEVNRKQLVIKYLIVLIAIAFIIPNTAFDTWKTVDIPKIFETHTMRTLIKKNTNVVILPYGESGSSMYYQYLSGMYFTQTGGYVSFPPPGEYASNPVVQSFDSNILAPNFKNNLKIFCAENRVTKIIYTSQTSNNLVKAINLLGWPSEKIGESTIVTVQL